MTEITAIQKEIIAEFEKRSGISILIGKEHLHAAIIEAQLDLSSMGSARGAYVFKPSALIQEVIHWCPDNMDERREDMAYMTGTLFHEMAHATQIRERLNRRFHPTMRNWMEETTVEMTAKRLSEHFNLLTPKAYERHNDYIGNWGMFLGSFERKACEEHSKAAMEYILQHWLPDFNKAYGNHKKAV